ncbi:MAG: outer membrane beta-barrel protein [Acidobacteriaceae bacterium]
MISRLTIVLLLGGSSLLHAQANPTASRSGDLQIGAGYTIAKPDYGQQSFQGFTAYADFDLRSHLGLEAEFHQVSSTNSDQSYQRTYEVGGRYFRTCGSLVPYLKAMIGRGDFNYPFGFTDLAYTLYAGGIGADYKLGPRLRLRGEYEIQSWSGFSNGGLTPQLVTFGVAYHFTGKPRFK